MLKQLGTRVGFVTGLAAGSLLGLGMLIGTLATLRWERADMEFPYTALHASATHGGDNFAMATGPIADGVEGVFFLDFITGDLQCWVINPRTGFLGGRFQHNVLIDLGADRSKKPSYLMVTGVADFRTGGGAITPAESVVYIADANTGRFAASSLPWNRNAAAVNQGQVASMVLIGRGAARNLEIREP